MELSIYLKIKNQNDQKKSLVCGLKIMIGCMGVLALQVLMPKDMVADVHAMAVT
jgi:hypothetical protein